MEKLTDDPKYLPPLDGVTRFKVIHCCPGNGVYAYVLVDTWRDAPPTVVVDRSIKHRILKTLHSPCGYDDWKALYALATEMNNQFILHYYLTAK